MNISKSEIDTVTVFRLDGDLDTNSSPLAEEAFKEAIAAGAGAMLVNLSDVGFVSSAGLRVLLAAAKQLGGQLKVCGLNETVNEVFEISGFSTIFSVFPTEVEALQG